MKKLVSILTVLLLSTGLAPHALANETICPATLKSGFEIPSGWKVKKETMELTFIGSSLIRREFACYYGVGRVALTKEVGALCKLKNSHHNPLDIDQGKVCNGQNSDCSLICP